MDYCYAYEDMYNIACDLLDKACPENDRERRIFSIRMNCAGLEEDEIKELYPGEWENIYCHNWDGINLDNLFGDIDAESY